MRLVNIINGNAKNVLSILRISQTEQRTYEGLNTFWKNKIEHPELDVYTSKFSIEKEIQKIHKIPNTNYLNLRQSSQEQIKTYNNYLSLKSNVEKGLKGIKPADKAILEYSYAIDALNTLGLCEYAETFFRNNRFKINFVTLRHFTYLYKLLPYLQDGKNLRIMEIGAGGGILRTFFKDSLKKRIDRYVIVDLPEMLALSAYCGAENHPYELHKFYQPSSSGPPNARNIYISAKNAELAKKIGPYDLFLNTHSFQEMANKTIQDYFNLIYATATPGAIFFNSNWHQPTMTNEDGSTWNNDPRQYPYRDSDEVLFFDEDPFHDILFKKYHYKGKIDTRFMSIRRIPG